MPLVITPCRVVHLPRGHAARSTLPERRQDDEEVSSGVGSAERIQALASSLQVPASPAPQRRERHNPPVSDRGGVVVVGHGGVEVDGIAQARQRGKPEMWKGERHRQDEAPDARAELRVGVREPI